MDRRAFLRSTARLAALAALGQLGACTQSQPVRFDRDPFSLGVASGDPLPGGVVLWTRLAPDPLKGGGMGSAPVDVEWLVARDDAMKDVVQVVAHTASNRW
jgi:alkaline phosphatase D